MQEASEWDRLARGCAVPREPRAHISSSVEGSVTVKLLPETPNFCSALLTPDLPLKLFPFCHEASLALARHDLRFDPKSVFPPLLRSLV